MQQRRVLINRNVNVNIDPLKSQNYRTQRPEQPEDLYQPLYDRVNYAAAGSSELSFFSVPRGQTATLIRGGTAATVSKTFRDTNIETSNVVPTKMFKLTGVSLAFIHEDEGEKANPVDRDKIRSGGYLHVRIVDKDLLYIPLILIPELNPFLIASTTENSVTVLGAAGGGGIGSKMYYFGIPITLNPYENFTIKAIFDGTVTTTKSVDVYCILHAFMRRPS